SPGGSLIDTPCLTRRAAQLAGQPGSREAPLARQSVRPGRSRCGFEVDRCGTTVRPLLGNPTFGALADLRCATADEPTPPRPFNCREWGCRITRARHRRFDHSLGLTELARPVPGLITLLESQFFLP